MQRIIISCLIIMTSFIDCFSQNEFREVASKYRKSEHYISSELNKKTIKLYLKEKQPTSEVTSILNQIDNLKIVSFKTSNEKDIAQFINSVNETFNIEEYIPFKVNISGLNNQLIYLKENNDKICNLIVINTNQTDITMVEILGNIELEKIAMLQNVLNINGLESLNTLNEAPANIEKSNSKENNHYKKRLHKHEFLISDNYYLPYKNRGVSIYNRAGVKLLNTSNEPSLLINGYQCKNDYHTALSELNPACIQSINVSNNNSELQAKDQIDVMLKGDMNSIYTICEGILYFGQNGYLQSIKIDDDCSPSLLHNCNKKPLSEILQMEPNQLKSIELTNEPRNCEGILDGEYVVIESK